MDDRNSEAITVDFENHVRVAGETLFGHVHINHALADEDKIEQVIVKLIGRVKTYITVSRGGSSWTYKEKIPLINSEISLWTAGSSPPRRYPFQFVLPSELPPSFHFSKGWSGGAIKYFVEVVGKRHGLFRSDRHIRKLFPVVPSASPNDISNKALLVGGWDQEWRSFKLEDRIRRWPWEGHSHVYAELSLPALSSFPISTPIPFHLLVVTETKSLRLSQAPSPFTTDKEPLFPAPPTSASRIDLHLTHHVDIHANPYRLFTKDRISSLGGMGDSSNLARLGEDLHMRTEEPEWVPQTGEKDEKDRGVWRRKVHFESSMTFSCPPSFSGDTLSNQHTIVVRIPFPGLGNELKSAFDINLISGVGCRPPPYGLAGSSSSGASWADTPPPGMPLAMDLPPSYWADEEQGWDEDAKG